MMSVTENSAFYPVTNPRPKYPSAWEVIIGALRLYLRDVVLGIALVALLKGPYDQLRLALGVTDRLFYAVTIFAAHTGSYALFNGTIAMLERIGVIEHFKMTRKPAEVASASLFTRLYAEAVINHFITSPISAYFLYLLAQHCGTPAASDSLPSIAYLAAVFAGAHAFNDVGFYWTHRIMHAKALYKTFHKKHHTFRGSVPAAAEFAHPVEVIISNQIPTMALVLGIGAHPLVQAVWLILRLTQTLEVHSGYAFDDHWFCTVGLLAGGASFHDHHHTVRTIFCFASLPSW